MTAAVRRVAIVGAGLAGAVAARLLADAGCEVAVFDKSRGVGGRMATRRVPARTESPALPPLAFDHGAPGFGARAPEFLRFVEQARRDGLLARWTPRVAPGRYAPLDDAAWWVPVPDLPALCRALLAGLPVQLHCTVDALRRGPAGWALDSLGVCVGEGFDAVVVTTPPLQAAPLVQAHRADWSQRLQAVAMLPGWTLMALTDDPGGGHDHASAAWDVAWPNDGPLSVVVRQDRKPGRVVVPGHAQWVAHATAAWSQTHLESAAAEVQRALQQALEAVLGRPVDWRHAAVHRWRYASAPRSAAVAERCWWDAGAGLGLCSDALGGAGVEGAWASGRALAQSILTARRVADGARPPAGGTA